MTSPSNIGPDLSQDLCDAFGSTISIHRLYLKWLKHGYSHTLSFFPQDPEWFTKVVQTLNIHFFACSEYLAAMLHLTPNSYSVQRT